MPASVWFLILGVAWVGMAFVLGAAVAAKRAFPDSRSAVARHGLAATVGFVLLVVLDLALARSGFLQRFDSFPPPTAAFMLGNILGVALLVSFSPLGTLLARHLSFSALVGFQAFRILAELLIFTALKEGLAPVQLSFEGYNFDIIIGATAIPVAIYLHRRRDLRLVRLWTWTGLGFLAVIAFIAATSIPGPIRLFLNEPSNLWVTTVPYVLLPGVMVTAAITGHLLVLRKLRMASGS